jgi:tRNA(Arg) A34 adenosine deaminase TadA
VPDHEKLMRRAIELAARARRNGNDPFGALLADNDGNVILEAENTAIVDRAATSHAETNLAREASKRFSRDELGKLILYASCEPCAMCAGAIFFAGIRTVVYGLSGDALVPMWTTKDNPSPALLDISCREVLSHCSSHPTNVIGPMLEEEAVVPHVGFWSQRLNT